MGKIYEQKINRFDGGIADDLRSTDFRFAAMVKHFDTTYPHKLIPYPKTEADETKSYDITKFLYAPGTSSTTFKLWGYGKAATSTAARIYFYDINAGTPDTTNWTVPSSSEGTITGRDERVFFHYKNYLYNWAGGTVLQRFGDLTSGATFTDAYQSIAYTDVAQPVHHPNDDIAYFFSDNKVHTLDNTTWSSNVLTLPDNSIITAGAALGNYLAIATSPKGASGSLYSYSGDSYVYLWNRNGSLATVSEKVNLGKGRVAYMAEVGGYLLVVMDYFINIFLAFTERKVIIKRISGPIAEDLRVIQVDNASSDLFENVANSFSDGTKLYFPAKIINGGDTNTGIYSVDANGKLVLEIVEEDATSSNAFQGIYKAAGEWWIAHSNDGSVNRTDNNGVYGYTSVYESLILNGGDSSQTKKLLGVTVTTEPMPVNGTVVLKYRKDEETSWTQIFSHYEEFGG